MNKESWSFKFIWLHFKGSGVMEWSGVESWSGVEWIGVKSL